MERAAVFPEAVAPGNRGGIVEIVEGVDCGILMILVLKGEGTDLSDP